MPEPTKILSKKDVANLLGVSPQTVYNYTQKGLLKAYSLGGGKVFYKQAEVLESLAEIS